MHTIQYSPGDAVYFLKDLTIQKGEVVIVSFKADKKSLSETYTVQIPSKQYQKHYDEEEWYEVLTLQAFELFSSKEELIAYIAKQGA